MGLNKPQTNIDKNCGNAAYGINGITNFTPFDYDPKIMIKIRPKISFGAAYWSIKIYHNQGSVAVQKQIKNNETGNLEKAWFNSKLL